MGLQEKKKVICQLSEQGKMKGRLCTTEILDALGDMEFSIGQMERLYDTLNTLDIEIVEDLGARSDLSYIIGQDECNAETIDTYLKAISEVTPVMPEDEEVRTGGYIDGSDPLTMEDPTADRQANREKVAEVMAKMSPLEQKVICLRFGLNGECSHTLEEVARQLNVPRERVRQLERKALGKSRPHAHRRKRLKDFLDE